MLGQNRLLRIFIMPLIVIVWIIGWGLYCAGFRNISGRSNKNSSIIEVTSTVLLSQESMKSNVQLNAA